MLAGEFLLEVPNDTINQLVWYFSKEADLKNYCPIRAGWNPTTYNSYRVRFVTAATIVALLSGSSVNGEMQKRLGDLSIRRNRAAEEMLNWMRDELMWLCDVLEDGGNYGREMETVSKGSHHPDAPLLGRMWTRGDLYEAHQVPGANVRRQFARKSDGAVQRRVKQTWGRR